jgi:sugar/nucleoside kinase (ribokinase family)
MSRPTQWDVIGVGCNSVDYVYRLPASPRADSPTAKLRISSHDIMLGGQTATVTAACAGLGLRAAYIGTAGDDDNGRLIIGELGQRGVDISRVMTRDCANRFAVITVDETTGDRIVLWDRDDRLNIARSELDALAIQSSHLVHVDDEDQEAAIAAAEIAHAAGVPVTSDIERVTDRTAALISVVTIPIFAQHLLPGITGEPDVERALRQLRQPHHRILCVTLGAGGAAMLVGDEFVQAPAFKVTAVDTTAAGDVFRAGFIYGLLNGHSHQDLLRFANAAAALACTRSGAIASVPSLEDIWRLIRQ